MGYAGYAPGHKVVERTPLQGEERVQYPSPSFFLRLTKTKIVRFVFFFFSWFSAFHSTFLRGLRSVLLRPLPAERLRLINVDKSLEVMEKLTRNTAQAPGEEKFRQVGET